MWGISNFKMFLYLSKIIHKNYPPQVFLLYMFAFYLKILKSKKLFRISSTPNRALLPHDLIDVNNCVMVDRRYDLKNYAKFKTGNVSRMVQVFGENVGPDVVLASEILIHNLKNSAEMATVVPVDRNNIPIATEVEISLINSNQEINAGIIDSLCENYFKIPKILYKGDLIAIEVRKFGAQCFYTQNKFNEIENVYFKCRKISCSNCDDWAGPAFFVFDKTSLKQAANVQGFVNCQLKRVKYFSGSIDYSDFLVSKCPWGLNCHLDDLERAVRPFCKSKLKLKPVFLIQGSKGSGKEVLLTSLASLLGMHLCKVSSGDLTASAYAQTETRVRNLFFKAKLCSPCILVINNFENFGKNNEGEHDERLINFFGEELDKLFENNNFPVVLICTSNAKEIPLELSRMFLQIFDIEAPDREQRCSLLEWIVKSKNYPVGFDLNVIADKAHGFFFQDLDALVYHAKKNRVADNLNFGDALLEADFEKSLDMMQSKYSESIGAPKIPKVKWADVGGLNAHKDEIIKTISLPLQYPELLKTAGLKRSGILLYGPPGTGKTLLAKAVATECNLCFLAVKGPELLNMYVGQSEQNVREVFERARQASPCIIFFDELDALAPNRGISGDSGGVMDRIVSQLLSEMDGLNRTATIFVIGATNRPDLIDPALLRPGRFDKLLYVPPCTDNESKLGVLKALTRRFVLSDDVKLDYLVKICPKNVTGADFYGLCSNAWMSAVRRIITQIEDNANLTHEDVIVSMGDFLFALSNLKPSVTADDLRYFSRLQCELSENIAS